MDLQWGRARFRSLRLADNNVEGWAALELVRVVDGREERAGRITFWDAEGQFAVEILVDELPLDVLEMFIAEARASIKIR